MRWTCVIFFSTVNNKSCGAPWLSFFYIVVADPCCQPNETSFIFFLLFIILYIPRGTYSKMLTITINKKAEKVEDMMMMAGQEEEEALAVVPKMPTEQHDGRPRQQHDEERYRRGGSMSSPAEGGDSCCIGWWCRLVLAGGRGTAASSSSVDGEKGSSSSSSSSSKRPASSFPFFFLLATTALSAVVLFLSYAGVSSSSAGIRTASLDLAAGAPMNNHDGSASAGSVSRNALAEDNNINNEDGVSSSNSNSHASHQRQGRSALEEGGGIVTMKEKFAASKQAFFRRLQNEYGATNFRNMFWSLRKKACLDAANFSFIVTMPPSRADLPCRW